MRISNEPVVGQDSSDFARLVREDHELRQSHSARGRSVEDVVRVAIQSAQLPERGERDTSNKLRDNVMKVDRAWLKYLEENSSVASSFDLQVDVANALAARGVLLLADLVLSRGAAV